MQNDVIVPAIFARLAAALTPPAGAYIPLIVDGVTIGWVDPVRVGHLSRFTDTFVSTGGSVVLREALGDAETRTAAMDRVARTLSAEGRLSNWRNERYSVAATFGGVPLMLLERSAARYFGIRTFAAHINGLVRQDSRTAMWIARRSATKSIDPDCLDNLVGGGIATGATVHSTWLKEAWEEAGITASMAQTLQAAGVLHICRAQKDGLQRETIFVSDLWLGTDFSPANQDGEVCGFRLMSLADVARSMSLDPGASGQGADAPVDTFTADASLVIVDCLLRHGVLLPDAPDYLALAALRHGSLEVPRRA